jgi:hypothetical protein
MGLFCPLLIFADCYLSELYAVLISKSISNSTNFFPRHQLSLSVFSNSISIISYHKHCWLVGWVKF